MSDGRISRLYELAESGDFFVEAALCNDVEALEVLLVRQRAVLEGVALAARDGEVADAIVDRLRALLAASTDADQLHRFDVAIATYLFVLSRANLRALQVGLEAVAGARLRNLHWAQTMGVRVAGRKPEADVWTRVGPPTEPPQGAPSRVQRSDSTDVRGTVLTDALT